MRYFSDARVRKINIFQEAKMAYKTTRDTKRDDPQQEEEVRCRKEDAKENTVVKKKSKKKEESDEPRKSRRPDLKAISQVHL